MFDPNRDITIDYFDGERRIEQAAPGLPPLRVTTTGLQKLGAPEFELVGIPVMFGREAGILLNLIADYAMNKRRVEHGQTWASRLPNGAVVAAKALATESFGRKVLRLADLEESSTELPAYTAICAIAVLRALELDQEGDPDQARALLKNAVIWFPGTPGPGLQANGGENLNQNNNLSYFALAQFGVRTDESYLAALARSADLRDVELGHSKPPKLAVDLLARDALIVTTMVQDGLEQLKQQPGADKIVEGTLGKGVSFLLTPVLKIHKGEIVQSLAMGPSSYRRYFYESPVKEQLRQSWLCRLAAEIYAKYVDAPDALLVLTRETATGVYEQGFRFSDPLPTRPIKVKSGNSAPQHFPLLSRILASLGRDLAAGLNEIELRARYGLKDDGTAREFAERKLTELREREDQEILAAYDVK